MLRSPCDAARLPRDPALTGIAWLERRLAEAGRAPHQVQVVKHRPGRRLVVRETGLPGAPALYWKLYRNDRGARLLRTHDELARLARARRVRFRVPAPVGYWPAQRALAVREAGGRPLTGLDDLALAPAAVDAGLALATLHDSGWQPPRRWGLSDEEEVLASACTVLERGGHSPGARAALLYARLVRGWERAPLAEAPLHRDFHPGQVLRDADGTITVLDWDAAARGPAVVDVANFAAHLRLEGLRRPDRRETWLVAERAFLDAYFRARRVEPWPTLEQFAAGTLLRLAAIALERRGDRDEALGLLDLAEAAACGAGDAADRPAGPVA
ncbi:MAG: phosphotransferase [Candidatus Eisenbacteria bacterium]|nr:phosphotransferase [Candidatus Eisenbacteria bacterium]